MYVTGRLSEGCQRTWLSTLELLPLLADALGLSLRKVWQRDWSRYSAGRGSRSGVGVLVQIRDAVLIGIKSLGFFGTAVDAVV